MKNNDINNYDTDGINSYVNKYIKSLGDLTGKTVLDCPAGDGRTSYQFKNSGANIVSADLFSDFFKLKGSTCDEVDLSEGLPYKDESFDIVICQEGIEHLQDQLNTLQEFARVLKPGGKLIITTPSMSHLRARLSFFLCESDYYKRSAPSELDSVWFSDKKKEQLYFGHIFLLNAIKLRTLAVFSGFRVQDFYKTDISFSSVLLFPLFYPLILLFNLWPFLSYSKKLKHIDPKIRKSVMKELYALNCSPKLLLCKHFFVVLNKEKTKTETVKYLKEVTRGL